MYLLPDELQQELLKYLATRPYHEVFSGIQALQRLEKQNEKEPVQSK